MPLHSAGEWLGRAAFEVVAQTVGDWTARLFVPALSFGRVVVAPLDARSRGDGPVTSASGGRDARGRRILSADAAGKLGAIALIAVTIAAIVLIRQLPPPAA